jgi:predicted DsbA family dithiol-disulfide isomerase
MKLEVWSDIACPWCYLGKRRLDAALAQYEHAGDVEVTYRSFELDPMAPADRGIAVRDLIARKYRRSSEEAQAGLDQMTRTAATDGLELRFDLARPGNTFDAHRLVHLAGVHGLQAEMKERLMRAYHAEGELVADHGALRRLAAEAGLPAAEVDDLLAGDRFAAEVRADEDTGADLGIQGVPFYVVDRRYAAAGAQDPEVLIDLFRRGRPE